LKCEALKDGSAADLSEVLQAVNKKGFALTGGVLTRCESVKVGSSLQLLNPFEPS